MHRSAKLAVGVLLLATTSCASFLARPANDQLRILTYNIHHGEGVDGNFDLPRIARVILDARPDLVALQEVDNQTSRSGGIDQAAELGRLTGMHVVFGKAMDYAGGGYGEAILSRYPIEKSRNHILPAGEGHEPRAAIEVVVGAGPGGGRVRFIGTHLDHTRDETDRINQALEILHIFKDDDIPMILAGDLNAESDSEPMRILYGEWSDTFADDPQPTIPVENPRRRIDYVLYRPADAWRVVGKEVIDERIASDHRPVLVVFTYK